MKTFLMENMHIHNLLCPFMAFAIASTKWAVRNYRSCSRREQVSFMGGCVEESFVLEIIDD